MEKTTNARKLAEILSHNLSYNDTAKKVFHRRARAVCRDIAEALKLTKDNYEIRSNLGGIAVSGEVTLHGDAIYIQFSQGAISREFGDIMYRRVANRKDYTGGKNHWMRVERLVEDFDSAIEDFQDVMINGSPEFKFLF
jgi:hypothetical protein